MNRALKTFITLVPVIALFSVTAATVYQHYFNEEYLAIYSLLSDTIGYGLFWLPVYYYMAEVYHLCRYTKVALIGLTIYSVLNIIYDVSYLFDLGLSNNTYIQFFEEAALASCLVLTLIFFTNPKNGD